MEEHERHPLSRGPITIRRELEAKAGLKRRGALRVGLAALAAFLAWQGLALRAFIRAEGRPPAWDQAIHLDIAQDYRALLGAGRWSEAWGLDPKPGMPPFPPLYQLGILAAQAVLGGAGDPAAAAAAALWLNGVYLALLCAALFGIAWEFRGDATAVAAVVLFACSPGIQYLAHTQLADLAVVAWTAAAYWAYFRSDAFAARGASVAFGLACAAGLLHKWSFFTYLAPPCLSALGGLRDPGRRRNAAAAGAVAVLLPAPWYLTHLPVLIPRLFQATSDFAAPFWRGGAFFFYFFNTAEHLGPALWFLGWLGVVVPDVRRNAKKRWALAAWAASSYLFWTLVPNRQIRFLLPGLPALAVLALGTWPRPVLWAAAAFQIFLSANYAAGWIGPWSLPLGGARVRCFPSDPPVREDWKISDILAEAARRKPYGDAAANVTLVANAERFNGPNFVWTAKTLGLPLRMRGVNRRLCEFSGFVVLKRGELGPRGVIQGLAEAAAELERPDGWFRKAYEPAGRWPLPDGSEAVLYAQRRLKAPPLPRAAVVQPRLDNGFLAAEDLELETGPWDPAASDYPRVRIAAGAAELRGLRISPFELELRDAAFVPLQERGALAGGAEDMRDARFLRMRALRVSSAAVTAPDLQAFLERRVPGLKIRRLELDGDIRVAAAFRGVPVSARAVLSLNAAPRGLTAALTQAKLGPLRIPLLLLGRYKTTSISFEPNPETPFAVEVPGLTLRAGRLTVP